jgi:hypothetical protein
MLDQIIKDVRKYEARFGIKAKILVGEDSLEGLFDSCAMPNDERGVNENSYIGKISGNKVYKGIFHYGYVVDHESFI